MTTLERFYQQVREARLMEPIPLNDPIPIEELQTPALIVDLDMLDANLAKMHKYLEPHGIKLRAHTKMHKCPVLAQKQIDSGARGICAAKISEAEVMCASGIEDVLVTSPIASLDKVVRFVQARKHYPGLKIVVDNKMSARLLAEVACAEGLHIDVLVDLDPGMGRTGVESGRKALELVHSVGELRGLKFAGLQMYAGNCMHIEGFTKRKKKYMQIMNKCIDTMECLDQAGIDVPVLSGGGTGTYNIEPDIGLVTELQAGSYAFMDMEYRDIGSIDSDQFLDFGVALYVLVTAISKPQRQMITVDAGFKSFASDKMAPEFRDVEGVNFNWGGDEHGVVQLKNPSREIKLGNKLAMLTPHCDPTVNLHDYYFPYREGLVHEIWPISARGMSN